MSCSIPLSLLPRDASKAADETSHLSQISLMGNEGSTSPFRKKEKRKKKTFKYIETKLCDRLKSLVQSPSELEGFSNEKIR